MENRDARISTESDGPARAGLALALMAGCLEGPEEPGQWHGLVHRSCGPTDGPSTYVQVDSLPAAGCADGEGDIPAYGAHQFNLEDVPVDSIRVGATYRDSTQICQLECGPKTYHTLTIESISADRIQGSLEVHTNIGAPRKLVRKVRVDMKLCPKRPVCG